MKTQITRTLTGLVLMGGVLSLATGCTQDVEECAAENLCEQNETESSEPCGADEADCRAVSGMGCGGAYTSYCRADIQCPDIAVACPDGQESCVLSDEDPACVEFAIGEDGCAETFSCRPIVDCEAIPTCEEGEEMSETACEDGEEACREVSLCGSTIYCRAGVSNCLAVPTCGEGESESEVACEDGEEACREVTECGQTIYCRAEVNCDAVPVCDEGELSSGVVCDDGEEACREVSLCGETIYCRSDVNCDAVPVCDESETESGEACGDDELDCRALTVCGSTTYCRTDRRIDQRISAGVCPPVEMPMDAYEINDGVILGDTLYLTVRYSGGCAEHIFVACSGDFAESEPVQMEIVLSHDGNNDACEAVPTEELAIDLTEIKLQYQAAYGQASGEIIINIRDQPEGLDLGYVF